VFGFDRYARRRGWLPFPVRELKQPEQLHLNPHGQEIPVAVVDATHAPDCPDERLHRWAKDDRDIVFRRVKPIVPVIRTSMLTGLHLSDLPVCNL
jgi:hypothetical protein